MTSRDQGRRRETLGSHPSEEPGDPGRPETPETRDLLWWLHEPDALVRRFVLSQVVGAPKSRQPWITHRRALGGGGGTGPSGGSLPPEGSLPPGLTGGRGRQG